MDPHWVKTVVRCLRHHRDTSQMCVRVERGVPEELRCAPGGGGIGGRMAAMDCPCGGQFTDLAQRVLDALRHDLNHWRRLGFVLIEY